MIITGIILASHGNFAVAALESIEMIAGKQENVMAFALTVDSSAEILESAIEQGLKELQKECDQVVILCDIYGGTPFNVISKLKLRGYNFLAFTGLSLPLLIDLCLSREGNYEELENKITETHQISLTKIEPVIIDDSDDTDL